MLNACADDGYIIEFLQIGNSIKVSACDPRTMREVSIVGSPAMPRAYLERNAVRKLQKALERRALSTG